MNEKQFLELVGQMLDAQQKYFKSRLQGDLIAAKDLEKRVRAIVKVGHLEPSLEKPVDTQPALFGGKA